MTTRRLLDLFCGAGGAAMGYFQAGFDEIVGVDIVPQPNYPFEFVQGDALTPPFRLDDFDLIHASPPCQHFTVLGRVHKDLKERYENHLPDTRYLLETTGRPWVIENVPRAPMRVDLELCGSMFDIAVQRHRWFELSGFSLILAPGHNHKRPRRFRQHKGPVSERPLTNRVPQIGEWSTPLEDQKRYMGVDWKLTRRELSEAIPPAYTKFIGEQFLNQLENV